MDGVPPGRGRAEAGRVPGGVCPAGAWPILGPCDGQTCPAGHPLSLGLHDGARPGLTRPPTISNPPPLISSTKHPSVLERQMNAISQVRREGQPLGIISAACRPEPPLPGVCSLTCEVGALGPVTSGWWPGHFYSRRGWGLNWVEPAPGTQDLGRSLHGVIRSMSYATRPCGLGQLTASWYLGPPCEVEDRMGWTHSVWHLPASVCPFASPDCPTVQRRAGMRCQLGPRLLAPL